MSKFYNIRSVDLQSFLVERKLGSIVDWDSIESLLVVEFRHGVNIHFGKSRVSEFRYGISLRGFEKEFEENFKSECESGSSAGLQNQ